MPVASEQVFTAIIAAQDETATVLQGVINRLKKLEQAAHGASHEAHELAEHGGRFEEFGEHIRGLGERFSVLREHIAGAVEKAVELLPALGALTGAGSLAGLFEMTEKGAEEFSELNAQAKRFNMTVEQLGGLQFAAKMSDVAPEKMTNGLSKLSLVLGQVVAHKNKDAAALFKHLGIAITGTTSAADILPKLAEAFKNTTSESMRARAAAALFGAKLGKELLPLLREGADGLDELTDKAKTLRYAVTPEDAEGLEHYHQSMIELQTAVGGFTTELSAKLAPVLQPIVDGFTDWVVANRDWITSDIAGHVDMLARALSNIDWAGWAHEARDIGTAMEWLHDKIGDVGTILIATAAIAWANPWLAAIGALILAAQEIYDHWGPIKDFFVDMWSAIAAAFDAGWKHIEPIYEKLKEASEWIAKTLNIATGNAAPASPASADPNALHMPSLPAVRGSGRHDHDDEDENRHVVTNYLHDTADQNRGLINRLSVVAPALGPMVSGPINLLRMLESPLPTDAAPAGPQAPSSALGDLPGFAPEALPAAPSGGGWRAHLAAALGEGDDPTARAMGGASTTEQSAADSAGPGGSGFAALAAALANAMPSFGALAAALNSGASSVLATPSLAEPSSALAAPSIALHQDYTPPPAPPPQQVDLHVQFENAPPGMSVSSSGGGDSPTPTIDVGHAMPGWHDH